MVGHLILVHGLGILIVVNRPSFFDSVSLRVLFVEEVPLSFVISPASWPVFEVPEQALVSEVEVLVSPLAGVELSEKLDVSDFDEFTTKFRGGSQGVNFIDDVALDVSVLQLVIPHDLVSI